MNKMVDSAVRLFASDAEKEEEEEAVDTHVSVCLFSKQNAQFICRI